MRAAVALSSMRRPTLPTWPNGEATKEARPPRMSDERADPPTGARPRARWGAKAAQRRPHPDSVPGPRPGPPPLTSRSHSSSSSSSSPAPLAMSADPPVRADSGGGADPAPPPPPPPRPLACGVFRPVLPAVELRLLVMFVAQVWAVAAIDALSITAPWVGEAPDGAAEVGPTRASGHVMVPLTPHQCPRPPEMSFSCASTRPRVRRR